MPKGILKYFDIAQGDFVKKIKIIPDSIIKLLGISCCSWMAWTSIDVQAVEQKIDADSSMVHAFESVNKSSNKGPFTILFDKDFIDPYGGNKATTESTIIVQRPLTFNADSREIAFANSSDQQEIVKIDMPRNADVCTFANIGAIEGEVNIAKGGFSVPAGVVKGVINNNGQLILVVKDGQVINESIKGSGAIKIKGDGVVKLENLPTDNGLVLTGKEDKNISLHLTTKNAPKRYLATLKEGDWIVFDQDFDGEYQGTLSGEGGLAKMGIGVLTLTGNNQDRSALTRIFSGEISIEKPENLGIHAPIAFRKGSLHITDSLELQNAFIGAVSFIVDEGKVAEISGQIGNNRIAKSSLDIQGKGTVFLKSPNSYTGDTTVSHATLQIQSETNLGDSKKLILRNATVKAASDANHLDLNRHIVLDEWGVIHTDDRTVNIFKDISSNNSEPADLYKEGSGKLAIHANIKNINLRVKEGFMHINPPTGMEEENVFAGIVGAEEIFQKIDQLTADRGPSTSPMVFLNEVSIDPDADVTISRNLAHIDNLYGSGKINLNADAGYLIVESGDFAGDIFSLAESASTTSPTIVKTGQKELRLNGDNSDFLGKIVIKEGKVSANSAIGGDVFVMQEGAFAGNAHVRGLLNQGIISPGNSIGVLKVEKDFKQGPTGRLHIEVNAEGKSDLVQVGNKAALDGVLCIDPEPGVYRVGTIYTILEAKEVEGAFQKIENTDSDELAFAVRYEPSEVIASVTQTMYQLPKDDKMSKVSKDLTDLMQKAQVKERTDAFTLVENLISLKENPKDLEKAYAQMAPLQLGGMTFESYNNAQAVADSFTGALRRNDRCVDSASTIWVDSIGHYAHQRHGYKLGNYKSYMGGVVIGGNHFTDENIVIGAGIGFNNSYLKWGKKAARSHITSFYAGLNGGWVGDLWYANASIITSMNAFTNTRFLQFARINHTIQSKHYGIGLTSRVEAGCNFAATKNICLRPFVDIDLYTIFERPVNEKKSPIHFHRDSRISHEIRSKVALEATGNFVCDSICFSPGLLLGYIATTPLRRADYKVSLNDIGNQLAIKGFKKSTINQAIALGANVVASHKETSIFLSYEFDFGKDRSFIHQASAGIDWKF